MHWVSGGLGAGVRWFVDEHGVHGHDVWACETLDVAQQLRKLAILGQHFIKLETDTDARPRLSLGQYAVSYDSAHKLPENLESC